MQWKHKPSNLFDLQFLNMFWYFLNEYLYKAFRKFKQV